MLLYDRAQLRELQHQMRDLAAPEGTAQRRINESVARELRGVLREEFATGEGAYGSWKPTVHGHQALESNRIAQTFFLIAVPGGVFGWSLIPWLIAHQVGATFAERVQSANRASQITGQSAGRYLTFNRAGKIISPAKIFNAKGEVRRGAYQRFIADHRIGARHLEARPMVPDMGRAMPPKWGEAINRGGEAGMRSWYEKAAA